MTEILSFFTIGHALLVMLVLMLVVAVLKIYDLHLVIGGESKFFSLSMSKPWMTILSRVAFYAGWVVIAMVTLRMIGEISLSPDTPAWVYMLVFSAYALIGLIIQMIALVVVAFICILMIIVISEVCLLGEIFKKA